MAITALICRQHIIFFFPFPLPLCVTKLIAVEIVIAIAIAIAIRHPIAISWLPHLHMSPYRLSTASCALCPLPFALRPLPPDLSPNPQLSPAETPQRCPQSNKFTICWHLSLFCTLTPGERSGSFWFLMIFNLPFDGKWSGNLWEVVGGGELNNGIMIQDN